MLSLHGGSLEITLPVPFELCTILVCDYTHTDSIIQFDAETCFYNSIRWMKRKDGGFKKKVKGIKGTVRVIV